MRPCTAAGRDENLAQMRSFEEQAGGLHSERRAGSKAQAMSAVHIDFYTRPGCHLCEDALEILRSLRQQFDFELRIVDISGSRELTELYGTQIPVAVLEGRKIFKYRADRERLHRILGSRL